MQTYDFIVVGSGSAGYCEKCDGASQARSALSTIAGLWHTADMSVPQKPLTAAEAVAVSPPEATADVRLWQLEKIKAGLKAADEGRFASAEAVKAVIRKFIPNG